MAPDSPEVRAAKDQLEIEDLRHQAALREANRPIDEAAHVAAGLERIAGRKTATTGVVVALSFVWLAVAYPLSAVIAGVMSYVPRSPSVDLRWLLYGVALALAAGMWILAGSLALQARLHRACAAAHRSAAQAEADRAIAAAATDHRHRREPLERALEQARRTARR